MAIDKITPYNMAAMQQMKSIQPTQAVNGQTSAGVNGNKQSSSSNNPFGGNTVGINSNIGVGDSQNIAAQAGKKAGFGRTLGIG